MSTFLFGKWKMRWWLFVVGGTFLVSFSPLPISNAIPRRNTTQAPVENVCLDKECVYAAFKVLANMDDSAEPCDDFYQFACGQLTQNADLKKNHFTYEARSSDVWHQVADLLGEESTPGELKPVRDVKTFYRICMNETRVKEDWFEPLLEALENIGSWPLLQDDWDGCSWSWEETVYKFNRAGFNAEYFVMTKILPKDKSSNDRVLVLAPPVFAIDRDSLLKGRSNERVRTYLAYMIDVADTIDIYEEGTQLQLQALLDFEIELAKLSTLGETLSMTTFGVLENRTTFPWKEYASNILLDYNVTDDDPVRTSVEYIVALEETLKRTPKRVVANYLMWRVTEDSLIFLSEDVRYLQQRFHDDWTTLRWLECAQHASVKLILVVSYAYVRRYMDPGSRQIAKDIILRLKEEISRGILRLGWLGNDTRQAALDKLEAMEDDIGYPDGLLDDGEITEYHKDMDVPTDASFFEANLALNRFLTGKWSETLRNKRNKTAWYDLSGDLLTTKASHKRNKNRIKVTTSYLQGARMSQNVFNYMQFASVGMILAHEILHGFDTYQGDDGNWLDEESETGFLKGIQCLAEQYNNYTVKQVNMNLNGHRTINENLADNGGLKYAYKAYLNWEEEHGEEPRLPGLQQYSPKQMFWLSFANIYCTSKSDVHMRNQIDTDYHSPNEFRVVGTLSNRPEFSKDFGCPLGARMNPVVKCDLW